MQRLLATALALLALGGTRPHAAADELILCGWDEVFILEVPSSGDPHPAKTWSWRAKDCPNLPAELQKSFGTTDECKPVDGGRKILVTSSGGGVALVDRATRRAEFWAFVGNAHSAEMLPGGRVVVAGSVHAQGNCLALFDLRQPQQPLHSLPLHSGHGVVWDAQRQLLWALGFDVLQSYALADSSGRQPRLELRASYRLPDDSGHDLQPLPNSDALVLSTNKHVYRFDRTTHLFTLDPDLGDQPSVKCVSPHPGGGRTAVVQGEGGHWWSSRLQWLHPRGATELAGQRLYKARWNVAPATGQAR